MARVRGVMVVVRAVRREAARASKTENSRGILESSVLRFVIKKCSDRGDVIWYKQNR